MGLVQIFRASPHPPLLAVMLLDGVLTDFADTGHDYLMYLAVSRNKARLKGEPTEAIDEALCDYALYSQIPKRWKLAKLFSWDAYEQYGDDLLPFWAAALIQIGTLEEYWENQILGLPTKDPTLLAGWHSDDRVYSTDWLDDFKPVWATVVDDAALPGEPFLDATEVGLVH